MPTTVPPRHRPASRGEADDHRIARGQIEIVDALAVRVAALGARFLRVIGLAGR